MYSSEWSMDSGSGITFLSFAMFSYFLLLTASIMVYELRIQPAFLGISFSVLEFCLSSSRISFLVSLFSYYNSIGVEERKEQACDSPGKSWMEDFFFLVCFLSPSSTSIKDLWINGLHFLFGK